jgi:hypothetical protein
MPRRQEVPEQLKRGPFTIGDAEREGFSRFQLRSRNWRRLGRGTYVWAGLEADSLGQLSALHARLPLGCVFSGLTAARLHGITDDGSAIELTIPHGVSVHARAGLSLRSAELDPSDVCTCGSLPVTTPLRTCFDLARSLPVVEAVAALDQALHRGCVALPELRAYVAGGRGYPGIAQARCVVELVEPGTESPMESRLRMILVLGGLPRPQVQVELHDARDRFRARPDLFYPRARLAIEYDGDNHKDRLVADNRRQNRLQRAGYRLLRYTAPDVYGRAGAILDEVRAQLRAAA